jgi:hypothetical protein
VSVGTGPEWWRPPVWSCRQEEASGQQIEPCPAEHLTFQQLQSVDVPFNGPLTPGQRHCGLDGGIVRAEASGETSEWRETTGGGACQPRLQLDWLALADEAGKILREGHGLCQRGRVRREPS